MQTDIPLRTLTRIRPADLLPLLGSPEATVLGVESLELPSVSTALDTLLRLRSPRGTIYLHLVEWQGYRDPVFLWRVLGYLADLGQQPQYRELVIAATLVYLRPQDDTGDSLRQVLDDQEVWSVRFPVVRLWEQDAQAALASGLPGMAVLSPLMRGATAELVERAATLVLAGEPAGRRQADLLTILGLFAQPLLDTQRFIRLIGKERLMASDLINYLMKEEREELERRLEREHTAFTAAVEDTLLARFPAAPPALVAAIREVRDPQRLRELHAAVLAAPDVETVEGIVREG